MQAVPQCDLGLRDAEDKEIFRAAKAAGVVVLTKDADFRHLLDRFGPPPQALWLTCGNTSNERLQEVLRSTLPAALELLVANEPLPSIANLRALSWPAPPDCRTACAGGGVAAAGKAGMGAVRLHPPPKATGTGVTTSYRRCVTGSIRRVGGTVPFCSLWLLPLLRRYVGPKSFSSTSTKHC